MHIIERNFEKVKSLFTSNNKSFVFESIIEGNTPGRIYVDDIENPETYVVFDGGNFVLYLGGEFADDNNYIDCIKYIKDHILTPALKEEYDDHILISYTSERWKQALKNHLGESIVHEGKRVLFDFDIHDNLKTGTDSHNFDVSLINKSVLTSGLKNSDELVDEITGMWGDVDGFVKNGFGTYAKRDDEILAWCTAEFLSKYACGIGIETIESEQKKGIGTAISEAFALESSKRGITPHWDSWIKNLPSVRVAEKSGFRKIEEYEVFVVKF